MRTIRSAEGKYCLEKIRCPYLRKVRSADPGGFGSFRNWRISKRVIYVYDRFKSKVFSVDIESSDGIV